MQFGPVPPTKLPKQDTRTLWMLLERWDRAAMAHESWAKGAKKATEYLEGKQWDADVLAQLEADGRPALTFNMIKPLVFLVLGFHRQNRTDVKYLPSNDSIGTENVSESLSLIGKSVNKQNSLQYKDAEVFLDGMVGGRGYYDYSLDFSENDLGDIKIETADSFSTYIDPDAMKYEPIEWGFTIKSRWVSIDEPELHRLSLTVTRPPTTPRVFSAAPWVSRGCRPGRSAAG